MSVGLLTLVLWLFAEQIMSIFGANDNVIEQVKPVLLISALLLPLSAVVTIVYGALRSAGDVIIPMAYSVATVLLVLVPLSWLFASQLAGGLAGLFWALVVAEAVRATLLTARWLRGRWAGILRR